MYYTTRQFNTISLRSFKPSTRKKKKYIVILSGSAVTRSRLFSLLPWKLERSNIAYRLVYSVVCMRTEYRRI